MLWWLLASTALAWPGDQATVSRQTGTGSSGTDPAATSPWYISYWLGEENVNEALSVVFPRIGSEYVVCKTTQEDQFRTGLCTRYADCPYYEGESFGRCGSGLGTCCVFHRSCDDSTNMRVSQFTSRKSSQSSFRSGECKLTVNPKHNNICQYRLDFDRFNIFQPNNNSDCTEDFFGVTGGSAVPKLCGDLTGQHIYVNVDPGGGPIILTMDTSKTKAMNRDWNIKITQIDCNSPYRAPSGCLQFYNETSGTVKSFNFKSFDLPANGNMRQIQNMNYAVCINAKVGYCEVSWTQSEAYGDFSFTVSGNGNVPRDQLKSEFGVKACKSDYVVIPGGTFEVERGVVEHADQYCGTRFPQVTTKSSMYVLYVVTDNNEEDDDKNLGFALNFRQNLC